MSYVSEVLESVKAKNPAQDEFQQAVREVLESLEPVVEARPELEKNGILKEIGDQKCSINRSKGLGENDPDMMWLTTMNPETRRLIKVEPEDVTKMETMFNLLLGNDEAGRKRHISEHGKEYLDQLDLQ